MDADVILGVKMKLLIFQERIEAITITPEIKSSQLSSETVAELNFHCEKPVNLLLRRNRQLLRPVKYAPAQSTELLPLIKVEFGMSLLFPIEG
jgi:hypothetical protein